MAGGRQGQLGGVVVAGEGRSKSGAFGCATAWWWHDLEARLGSQSASCALVATCGRVQAHWKSGAQGRRAGGLLYAMRLIR